MTPEAEIAQMLDRWSAAVRAHDLEGSCRDRSPDIVMFDVPEPLQARGIEAYRDTWRLYFGDPGSRRFRLLETEITVGGDVAWVRAILDCTMAKAPAGRLTLGLRRQGARWVVEHEHHSIPWPLVAAGA